VRYALRSKNSIDYVTQCFAWEARTEAKERTDDYSTKHSTDRQFMVKMKYGEIK
jgi:hypothetical protein